MAWPPAHYMAGLDRMPMVWGKFRRPKDKSPPPFFRAGCSPVQWPPQGCRPSQGVRGQASASLATHRLDNLYCIPEYRDFFTAEIGFLPNLVNLKGKMLQNMPK